MSYDQALAYLDQYTNYERELRYPYDGWHMNLERVGVLLGLQIVLFMTPGATFVGGRLRIRHSLDRSKIMAPSS